MKRLEVLAGLVLCASIAAAAQQSQSQSPPASQKPAQAPAARNYPPPRPGPWQQVTPMAEDKRVQVDDIDKLLEDGKVFFLDVREPKEIEELGTREGYYNIPVGELEDRLNELPKDKAILTAWNGGGRAARAAAILEKHGFKAIGFCGLSNYKGKKIFPKAGEKKNWR